MEKRIIYNLCIGSLLLVGTFLSSCNNDLKEEVLSGNRILTFNVGVGFEDYSAERSHSFSEKPDTIYQDLGNGIQIEAVIEEDKIENSRSLEDMKTGVAVLAIVYNTATNRVHSVQNLAIIAGKLTCQIPDDRNVKVVFYSYNTNELPTTSLRVNDPITEFDEANSAIEFRKDVLRVESMEITPTTSTGSLGSIVFKHVFSKIKTEMKCNKKFRHFIVEIGEDSARRHAALNVVLGTVTLSDESVPTIMHGYNSTSVYTVSSSAYSFIPTNISSHSLSFTEVDEVPIVVPPVILNKKFELGRSYTLKVTLKK